MSGQSSPRRARRKRAADVHHEAFVERHEVARHAQLYVSGEAHALREHVEEREEEYRRRDEQQRRALAHDLEDLARAHDRLREDALQKRARVAEPHGVVERVAYPSDYGVAALLVLDLRAVA